MDRARPAGRAVSIASRESSPQAHRASFPHAAAPAARSDRPPARSPVAEETLDGHRRPTEKSTIDRRLTRLPPLPVPSPSQTAADAPEGEEAMTEPEPTGGPSPRLSPPSRTPPMMPTRRWICR